MRDPDGRPRDDPRAYLAAFVVLLATAGALPDGFELVAVVATLLIVAASLVLAALDARRGRDR